MASHDEERGSQVDAQEAGTGLRRVYNVWTASAYQVLMMASWTCNIVLYSTVFDLGGPMMLVYSTIVVTFGQSLTMGSLAELCSVYPFAGGQQSFTKALAPVSIRRFLSYLTGWFVLLGEISTSAACAMNNASIVGSLVQLTYPSYTQERYQTWLFYTAFLFLAAVCCTSQKYLPHISVLGAVITAVGGVVWAASFLALSPKASAEFALRTFINNSGYASTGWVAIMSLYTPLYALYGTDGILHIVEEIKNPRRDAPRAMVWSMAFSGFTSLLGALVMAFCPGDWESYMEDDEPWVAWFMDTVGSGVGIAFVVIIIILLNYLITIGVTTAASRLAWSLARDNALPFSPTFFSISPRFNTPLNAVMLVIISQVFMGFIAFGSDYAFEAIVSFGNAAIQIGYLIPILMLLLKGRVSLPNDRAFNLGRFGLAINIGSICWTTLTIITIFFPLYVPVNAENIYNMNWAILIVGSLMIIIVVDWFFRGRFHYKMLLDYE